MFFFYGFIILQTTPGNKTNLFFETWQVFIAYIGKQILPFASRQGIITSSDTNACIDSATFAANLPLFFGVYIVGSLVFNGGCVLLMKPARYLAARSVKNDVKADA